jgi:hypothetical protein
MAEPKGNSGRSPLDLIEHDFIAGLAVGLGGTGISGAAIA